MSHKRRRVRAFGLTLIAVLGLTAFMAVSAHANWLYLEGAKSVELTENEIVTASAHKAIILLVPEETKLEITCEEVQGIFLELIGKSAKAEGKVAFNGCTTKQGGKAAEGCNPLNQPIEAGGIADATATVILHTDGRNYILFGSATGGPFAVLEFNPTKCSLPEFVELNGSLVAECGLLKGEELGLGTIGEFVGNDCSKHMKWHLLQQAAAALFPNDTLKFGKKAARLDGLVKVELAGRHAGASWAGQI